ncbi:MAG: hypothetical protein INH41_03305 [Myxococcaceae bacterium]|jgi:hypothetical protein|nr:hypothetical protein [Myxococcaceae bacterium]
MTSTVDLSPARRRLVTIEALCEAIEMELAELLAALNLADDLREALADHRYQVGLVASFAHLHGWPGAKDPEEPGLVGLAAQLAMLSSLLKLVMQVGRYVLELIEAPGPDYRPELADYLRGRLLPGLERARQQLEHAAWGSS